MKKKKKNSSSEKQYLKHSNPFQVHKKELLNLINQQSDEKQTNTNNEAVKNEVFCTTDTKAPQIQEGDFMKDFFPDVKPLSSDERVPSEKQEITPKINNSEENSMEELLGDFLNSDEGFSGSDFNIEFLDEFVSGIAPEGDIRILNKLKKGEYSYQSYLDLHGYTWNEAKTKILSVITNAQRDGKRCILIVHGRGLHSKTNYSVLKRQLINMLTRGSLRKKILAFSTALPVHGGPGSMYVLLRKNKNKS